MKMTKRFLLLLACFAGIYVTIALVRGNDPFAFGGPIAGALAALLIGLPVVLIIDAFRRWRARGRVRA